MVIFQMEALGPKRAANLNYEKNEDRFNLPIYIDRQNDSHVRELRRITYQGR